MNLVFVNIKTITIVLSPLMHKHKDFSTVTMLKLVAYSQQPWKHELRHHLHMRQCLLA